MCEPNMIKLSDTELSLFAVIIRGLHRDALTNIHPIKDAVCITHSYGASPRGKID